MSEKFKEGDKVVWKTDQGATKGKAVRKQISETKIEGHTVEASSVHRRKRHIGRAGRT